MLRKNEKAMAQKTAQKSKQAQAARHTPARKKKRSVVFDVVLGLFVLAIIDRKSVV